MDVKVYIEELNLNFLFLIHTVAKRGFNGKFLAHLDQLKHIDDGMIDRPALLYLKS